MVLRGASEYMLDEAERSLHDALCMVAQTIKVRCWFLCISTGATHGAVP